MKKEIIKMKVVFATIPMQSVKPALYKSEENRAIEYQGEVRFPINALLAKTLKKGDEVKVVQVVTEGEFSDENVKLHKEELDKINENIGAKITYTEVRERFRETSDIVQSRFRQILGTLENECEIYADCRFLVFRVGVSWAFVRSPNPLSALIGFTVFIKHQLTS